MLSVRAETADLVQIQPANQMFFDPEELSDLFRGLEFKYVPLAVIEAQAEKLKSMASGDGHGRS